MICQKSFCWEITKNKQHNHDNEIETVKSQFMKITLNVSYLNFYLRNRHQSKSMNICIAFSFSREIPVDFVTESVLIWNKCSF